VKTLRVFIAEDNATERKLLRDIVENAPMPTSVRETDNGREALILLSELGDVLIDLAFLDIGMPGMSGLEALGGARFLGHRTMTVVMSHTVNERRRVLARDLKAYDYLLKPFSIGQVHALLEAAVANTARWRFLIGEDRDDDRKQVTRSLKEALGDVSMVQARSFPEVEDYVARRDFDAVFLDLHMQERSAIETARYLRRWFPNLKIILMSANPVRRELMEIGDIGVDGYLQKPFTAMEAKRVVFKAFKIAVPHVTGLYKDQPILPGEEPAAIGASEIARKIEAAQRRKAEESTYEV